MTAMIESQREPNEHTRNAGDSQRQVEGKEDGEKKGERNSLNLAKIRSRHVT